MEAVFLAVLMGCSDDLSVCDPVAEREITAASADACEMRMLERPEARSIDYPAALVTCRLEDEPSMLIAGAPSP